MKNDKFLHSLSSLSKSLLQTVGLKRDRHSKTDVYIISYPKCGRTWLRVLIGKALCEKYKLSEELLLDTYALTKKAGILKTQFIHDLSSHISSDADIPDYRELKHDKSKYKNKKVIFLIRDIKDTLVSCYFQVTKRRKFFEGNISDFLRSDRFGVKKIITFYNIWHENRFTPKEFLLLRYEDMHASTYDVLSKTLAFLGVKEIEPTIINNAISYARFENMKRMEQNRIFQSYKLRPADENDPESFKVRRGTIGGYKDYLSDEDIEYIDSVIKEMGCPFLHEDRNSP